MGWIVGAASSGTALADYARADNLKPLLKVKGASWEIRGGGSTASVITLRYGDSSGATISSLTLAASTGGSGRIDLSALELKAGYFGLAATSNVATSNSVLLWGE